MLAGEIAPWAGDGDRVVIQVKGVQAHDSQVTNLLHAKEQETSMLNYEIEKMLIDIAYMNLGLVPPSHYPRSVDGSLDSCLGSLPDDESRRARRKFRKVLRRSRKGKKGEWEKSSYDTKQSMVRWYVTQNYVNCRVSDNDD